MGILGNDQAREAVSVMVGSNLGRGARIRLLGVGELKPDGNQGARELKVRGDSIVPRRVWDSEFSRLWEKGTDCKVKRLGDVQTAWNTERFPRGHPLDVWGIFIWEKGGVQAAV